jgi:Family of unknown function (DUF6460)
MSDQFQRFMGGSPASVIVKLIFVSLIVGALMAFLGLSPLRLLDSLVRFIRSITDLGFDAVREVFTWVVAGALIVVPIWFIMRLLKSGKA